MFTSSNRKARIVAAGAIFAALAASALLLIFGKTQYLVLINERTGVVLYEVKAPDGTEFSIEFIHSVNKSPVKEYYIVADGRIYLTAVRYESFGAGIPSELEDGQTMRLEDGTMLITGYDRHIPRLCYFISRTEGHALDIGAVKIMLDTLDAPGEPILFTIKARLPR